MYFCPFCMLPPICFLMLPVPHLKKLHGMDLGRFTGWTRLTLGLNDGYFLLPLSSAPASCASHKCPGPKANLASDRRSVDGLSQVVLLSITPCQQRDNIADLPCRVGTSQCTWNKKSLNVKLWLDGLPSNQIWSGLLLSKNIGPSRSQHCLLWQPTLWVLLC